MAGGKRSWGVVLGVLIALSMAPQRAVAQQGEAYARMDGGQCAIGNGAVERTIRLADPVQTTLIKNKIAGKEIALNLVKEFANILDEFAARHSFFLAGVAAANKQ